MDNKINYISQINGFWTWRMFNEISHSAADLYFAILNCANKSGWKTDLHIPNSTLCFLSGIPTVSMLAKLRAVLINNGLIEFTPGRPGRAGTYRLHVFGNMYDENNDCGMQQGDTSDLSEHGNCEKDNCRGSSDCNTDNNSQGNTHGNTHGNTRGNTQGTTHGNTQDNTHGNTQGNTHGNTHGNTQGNTHDQIMVRAVTPYINKDKDVNKDINNNNPPLSPQGENKGRCNNAARNSEIKAVLEEIGDIRLRSVLNDFVKMRKSIKKPLTSKALNLIIARLYKLSPHPETQCRIIEQSILHCWQDVYPLKDNTKNAGTNNPFIAIAQKEGLF